MGELLWRFIVRRFGRAIGFGDEQALLGKPTDRRRNAVFGVIETIGLEHFDDLCRSHAVLQTAGYQILSRTQLQKATALRIFHGIPAATTADMRRELQAWQKAKKAVLFIKCLVPNFLSDLTKN